MKMDSVFMAVILSCFVKLLSGVPWEIFSTGQTEIGGVTIDHVTLPRMAKRKRSAGSPAEIDEIRTRVRGLSDADDITLTFKRKYNTVLAPILSSQGGNKAGNQSCTFFFEDTGNHAHAVVNTCETPHGLTMMAEVIIGNNPHFILPVSVGEGQGQGQIVHKLYKCDRHVDFTGDYIDNNNPLDIENKMNLSAAVDSARARRNTATYTVELVIVADYSLYKYWYQQTTGSTEAERATKAKQAMQSYYSFFTQAMDLRYQGLDLGINVELVAVYVLGTAAESTLTNAVETQADPRGLLDSVPLLTNFENLITNLKSTVSNFPVADHYMLITYRDLSLNNNKDAAGYANVGEICTSQSLSVVEENFDAVSITTGAHELGHSLGGKHDGDGNTCSSSNGFILAISNFPMTDEAKRRNLWFFSTCSKAAISAVVSNDTKNGCLKTDDNVQVISPSGKRPGQVYSPDEQCKRTVGSHSSLSRSSHNGKYDSMCTGMFCVKNSTHAILAIPLPGTTCGDRKWCINGECVDSEDAPAVSEASCMFGDHPGEYQTGETCATTITDNLNHCYEPQVIASCCASCPANALTIPGCLYGNSANCPNIVASQCYGDTVRRLCCKTCNDFLKQDVPDICRYGDRKVGCTLNNCALSPTDCCETCKDYTGDSGTGTDTGTGTGTGTGTDTGTGTGTGTDTGTGTGTDSGSGTGTGTDSGSGTGTGTDSGSGTGAGTGTGDGSGTKRIGSDDDLPEWVIPTAASVGGMAGIAVLGLLFKFCCTSESKRNEWRAKGKTHYHEYYKGHSEMYDKHRYRHEKRRYEDSLPRSNHSDYSSRNDFGPSAFDRYGLSHDRY